MGVLKAAELRNQFRGVTRLRRAVQIGSALLVLSIGFEFVRWVRGIEQGGTAVSRPGGVEGFLPIAALMSLRHLWSTGEVHPVRPAALVILLAVLVTSIVLKKAFCSWICPIGTLSELLADAGRWTFGRTLAPPRWLDLPLRGLKYALLAFFAWTIFAVMAPPEIAAFLDSPYSRVADVKMLYFFERATPGVIQVMAGLALLSLVIPYFWCRYLCPYGALLGLASLLSPFKVTRHADACIDCGLCTKACPSRLPVARLTRVRSDECFGCLSCVAACPVPTALRVEAPRPVARPLRPAAFAALVALLFLGTIAVGRLTGHWRTSVSEAEYATRVRELDGPAYGHFRGRLPAADPADAQTLR
ncbi:MAG: 4Fe-4S binding protein [Vicinamibacteria bacterium]